MIQRRALLTAAAIPALAAFTPARKQLLLSSTSRLPPGISLDLSFMTPGTLPSGVTFTRASTGTYFDVAGVMQTATTNSPRWDYDPVTHVLKGMLVEEARTNSVTNSGPLTDFVVDFTTKTAAATVAPDGTTTGVRITEDTSGAEHSIDFAIASTVGSTAYTATVFMKANTRTNMGLEYRVAGNWVGGNCMIIANLSGAGSLFTYAGTPNVSTIQSVGNGWYRVSLTATSTASPVGASSLRIGLANSSTTLSYTGDGASNAYAWGAQLEVGAFSTSYIPTTATAATRAIEVCQTPTGAWFTSNATLSFNMEVMLNSNVSRTLGGISDGVLANSLYLGTGGGGSYQALRAGAGGGTATDGASTTGVVQKVCESYNATTMAVCANGGTVASLAITAPALTTATRVGIGNDPWGLTTAFSGWVRRVRYWPRALSNAELQAATT